MYCFSGILRSKALHTSTPFVEGALQLVKLQLAHKNASQDGNKKACTAIEKEFYREVEAFRPCFTLSASLEVAQKYSKHIYSALCYFGMRDDPLIRQIDPLVGKAKMRTARASKGMFKGVSGPISKAFTEKQDDFSLFEEPEVTVFPDELPNPPQVNLADPNRRFGAVRVPPRHRGHWVLQEAEIAITKNERKEDPW